ICVRLSSSACCLAFASVSSGEKPKSASDGAVLLLEGASGRFSAGFVGGLAGACAGAVVLPSCPQTGLAASTRIKRTPSPKLIFQVNYGSPLDVSFHRCVESWARMYDDQS